MAEVINGYECVLNGEKKGFKYLIDLIETYRITDDEIIYLVHIAAEIVERRQTPELSLVSCYSN
ncbi:hypothetical protein [uncultured Sneathiella sp.]|uniref:hypothetical protein n=1 Tax=uncultured Sneathiella sp. TaxID=879315 RepID=UPI0030ED3467|tara:strand:+ start:36657 stop:36848 length:192 start_codon:yes stop_codon:yes gene_type:complete